MRKRALFGDSSQSVWENFNETRDRMAALQRKEDDARKADIRHRLLNDLAGAGIGGLAGYSVSRLAGASRLKAALGASAGSVLGLLGAAYLND